MATLLTQPNPAPGTSSTAFRSFADYVDYPTMFGELETRGITLTEDEKARCQQICSANLRHRDGGSVIGNGLGGVLEGIGVTLVTFMKNLLTGNWGGIKDMFTNFGSTVSNTGEQSKLWQLQQDAMDISERLKVEGGNLAAAAEYITGVKPSDNNSPGKILQASVLNQVGRSINLPVDTNTSLNADTSFVAGTTPPGAMAGRGTTQGLTGRH